MGWKGAKMDEKLVKAAVTAKAHSTIGTTLKMGETVSALNKVCPIKSFPQLGGEPEQIEITDMEDEAQTFVPGVKSQESMAFTANYTNGTFTSLKELEGKELIFELNFGKDGSVGKFSWKGQLIVFVNEGEVNGGIEMTISVTPSSEIQNKPAATAFPG